MIFVGKSKAIVQRTLLQENFKWKPFSYEIRRDVLHLAGGESGKALFQESFD